MDEIASNAIDNFEGTAEVCILPYGQILNQSKYMFRNILPKRLEDEIELGWPKQRICTALDVE